MSYSLGQAKLVPGQIHFQTTRTGRIPSVQPLIEAGLPIAPYIEHGSWATGQPSIMRYGLDPYRGLGWAPQLQLPSDSPQAICQASGGRWVAIPGGEPPHCEGGTREAVETAITETIRTTLSPAVMIGTGAFVGGAAGISGGVLKSPLWGALIGVVGGGLLGYLGWKNFAVPRIVTTESPSPTSGLSGLLAVL